MSWVQIVPGTFGALACSGRWTPRANGRVWLAPLVAGTNYSRPVVLDDTTAAAVGGRSRTVRLAIAVWTKIVVVGFRTAAIYVPMHTYQWASM